MIMATSENGTKKVTVEDMVTDVRMSQIKMQSDICWLKKIMSNHLAHHWYVTVSVAISLLTAIGVLVMYIIARC